MYGITVLPACVLQMSPYFHVLDVDRLGLACTVCGTYSEKGVSGVFQYSALRERVRHFILHRQR